ncbi:carbon-nitrogen hydrolase [Hygrophoropsis aurantiaca]|uniref:Carbon-nitrogen hydrolase n=1 Tax=Hygrophoropsis aurantiaca TaxID=72124 RepID=A0ACB8A3N5_9AGAM|nr:carbon-nitrogen hydrolase [Hygrophoropsis aurantiaca]
MSSFTYTTPPPFKPFDLTLIQLGGVGSDKAANLQHARDMILKAAHKGGQDDSRPKIIVLPEIFNSPYGHAYFPIYAETIGYIADKPYDTNNSPSDSVRMLSSVAKEIGTWIVGGSIAERGDDGKIYNTCELVAMHRKVHLFDIDIPGKMTFKESETLTGGSSIAFFDTEFARIGLGICYDVRFPEVAMINARKGCHVLIYPAAFNLTTGPLHWKLLQQARAVDNQVFFSMCSPARDTTASYHAWGHSMVVDPLGTVLAEAEHEESILHVYINPKVFDDARAGIPVTTQRRFDVYLDVSKKTS